MTDTTDLHEPWLARLTPGWFTATVTAVALGVTVAVLLLIMWTTEAL